MVSADWSLEGEEGRGRRLTVGHDVLVAQDGAEFADGPDDLGSLVDTPVEVGGGDGGGGEGHCGRDDGEELHGCVGLELDRGCSRRCFVSRDFAELTVSILGDVSRYKDILSIEDLFQNF